MAYENKPFEYARYAIGEILLVVIGILIALQVNNWNENRKENIKRDYYLNSFLADLQENIQYLSERNNYVRTDFSSATELQERITSEEATIDTVIKIASEDVSLLYYSITKLNENTYQSLTNTGQIEYLDPWLQEELQKVKFMTEDLESTNKGMFDDYSSVLIEFLKVFPRNMDGNSISKKLGDIVVENRSVAEKISTLNSLLWIKTGAYYSTLIRSEPLEAKLKWLSDTLLVEYPFLNN